MENINSTDINLINSKIKELNGNIMKILNNKKTPINISDYYIYQQLKYKYKLKYQLFLHFNFIAMVNYNNYMMLIEKKIQNKINKSLAMNRQN